jgi:hypothetical protein
VTHTVLLRSGGAHGRNSGERSGGVDEREPGWNEALNEHDLVMVNRQAQNYPEAHTRPARHGGSEGE